MASSLGLSALTTFRFYRSIQEILKFETLESEMIHETVSRSAIVVQTFACFAYMFDPIMIGHIVYSGALNDNVKKVLVEEPKLRLTPTKKVPGLLADVEGDLKKDVLFPVSMVAAVM